MELSSFVTKTLEEIHRGVDEAGKAVNDPHAFSISTQSGSGSSPQPGLGLITFDVAVAATTVSDKEKGGILKVQIINVGINKTEGVTSSMAQRVHFSVLVSDPARERSGGKSQVIEPLQWKFD